MTLLPTHTKRRKGSLAMPLIAIITGTLVCFSGYGGMINPAHTTAGALALMLFPFCVSAYVILCVICILFFKRAAIYCLLFLIAITPAFLTYCPLNFFRPSVTEIEKSENYIKVMSYNLLNLTDFSKGSCLIGGGNPTLEYILSESPDILAFQEGEDILSNNRQNISDDQHSRLLATYPYHFVDVRGMGMLSKYPFTVTRINHPQQWMYDINLYTLDINGEKLNVLNLHLQSLGLTKDDKALYHDLTNAATSDIKGIRKHLIRKLSEAYRQRAVQAKVVRNTVDSIQGNVMVCGDFNDIPGCYAQRVIMGSDMHDAYREAGLGPAITYHADRFFFRIDHILYRGDIEPLRAFNGQSPFSDHYPLVAYFRITK